MAYNVRETPVHCQTVKEVGIKGTMVIEDAAKKPPCSPCRQSGRSSVLAHGALRPPSARYPGKSSSHAFIRHVVQYRLYPHIYVIPSNSSIPLLEAYKCLFLL